MWQASMGRKVAGDQGWHEIGGSCRRWLITAASASQGGNGSWIWWLLQHSAPINGQAPRGGARERGPGLRRSARVVIMRCGSVIPLLQDKTVSSVSKRAKQAGVSGTENRGPEYVKSGKVQLAPAFYTPTAHNRKCAPPRARRMAGRPHVKHSVCARRQQPAALPSPANGCPGSPQRAHTCTAGDGDRGRPGRGAPCWPTPSWGQGSSPAASSVPATRRAGVALVALPHGHG